MGNPLSYKDLFDFTDNGGVKGALRDVTKLKGAYKEFIEVVSGGQLAAISKQQEQLAETARQLATATRELNVSTKQGQKDLIENAKLMSQLESANRKLIETTRATKTVTDSAGSSINALEAKLKEQISTYKQMASATDQDRAALDKMAGSINKTRADISQLTQVIRTNVNGFNAAKGSYAALDAETRKLVSDLKGLEGGMNKNNAAAAALRKQIYSNTTQLKEFDAQMNQNFRNVGNYGSALGGVAGQLKVLALGYLSVQGAIQVAGKAFNTALATDAVRASLTFTLGSTEAFDAKMKELSKTAQRLGIDLVPLSTIYSKFAGAARAANFPLEETDRIFNSITGAAARFNLTSEQLEGSLLAVQQMISKGTVQSEELRGQLGERLPGAFSIAARAMGVTEMELGKLLKSGKVLASDLLPKLATELDKTFDLDASTKIDTLTASFNRLKTSFDQLISGQNVNGFFKWVIEGADGIVSALNKLVNSRSWQEFTARFFTYKKSDGTFFGGNADNRWDKANQKDDLYKSSSAVRTGDNFNPTGADPKFAAAALAEGKSLKELTDLRKKYLTATTDAARAYDIYRNGIAQGILKDAGKNSLKDVETNFRSLQKSLAIVNTAYGTVRMNTVATSKATRELTDEELTAESAIRKRINELKKLDGSAVDGSPINNRIDALKARLKGLTASATPAKDAIEKLEEQVKALNAELTNGLADGRIDATDRAILKKIQSANEAIAKINELRRKIQFGDGPPVTAKGDPNEVVDISREDGIAQESNRKSGNLLRASDFADQASDIETRFSEMNVRLLGDYRMRNITKQQYDEQYAQIETDRSNKRYFVEKNRIAALLANEVEGSKAYIQLKEQEANLDARHADDQVRDYQRVEAARLKAIEVVIDIMRNNLQPLANVLGQGFGTIFSTLTDDLQKFAENGKLSFEDLAATAVGLTSGITQAFIAASEARIQQLGVERDRDLESAGNNEAAKKAINERYNKAVAEERRKQAKLEKEAALISIAINTAVAVVKALPNIPLAIAIGVLGAVQLALVAAKPLPKYKGGRDGGPGEFAVVNDGAGPEALVKGNRVRFAGGGKETATWLEPGEKVLTAEKTAKIFSDDKASGDFVESLIQGTGVVLNHERVVSEKMMNAIVNSKMSPEMLTACFREALSDLEIQQLFIDEKGARTYNKRKNQLIWDQNARHTTGGIG